MKLTAWSKSVRTIVLMTLLSSIVTIPNLSKTAQAQTESIPNSIKFLTREQLEQGRLDAMEQDKICNRVMEKESNIRVEGGFFFDDFQGLTLTDAQKKAYEALDAQKTARMENLYKQTISVADPSSIIAFWNLSRTIIPQKVQAAIEKELDRKPTMDQLPVLNQRFGNKFGNKLGFFYSSYVTYLTPEQETQLAQIGSDFHSRVPALMTPEQQPQYSKNLAARLRINAACDAKQTVSTFPPLGRIVNTPLPY